MRFLGAIMLATATVEGRRPQPPWLDSLKSGNDQLLLTPPTDIHIAGLAAHRRPCAAHITME
jgi:hypothetical protein